MEYVTERGYECRDTYDVDTCVDTIEVSVDNELAILLHGRTISQFEEEDEAGVPFINDDELEDAIEQQGERV